MLQTIREHTQGWIAGIIISIIILSFALWGIHSYFVGGASNVVAKVNGIDITKEQLAIAYERMRRQIQIQYGANSPIKDETALKSRALQALIDIEVLKQASTSQGYLISDQQIDAYLQGMPDFQVDGQFSFEKFQQVMAATMLSTSDFLEVIRTNLLLEQPKLGIVLTSFALPDETNYTISLVNQERDIDYLTLPFQQFAKEAITISPEKVQAYYEQNKNSFMTPEQVNLDYIEVSLKDLYASVNPTDAALKNFYSENINSYTKPMQWKLQDILVPVTATASDDEVAQAKKKIDSIAAAIQGGQDFTVSGKSESHVITSTNWLTLGQVTTELQKAVAELSAKGQVSAPVRTAKGFVIVKAVDIAEPKIQPFDIVKTAVKDSYVRQHAEEKMSDVRERLADMTYEHPESLQFAAKNLNLPVQTSVLFTKDKGGNDISQSKKVRELAFSNDVLNMQNNSDVIQINPETIAVIRIKSHIASALLPLSSVSKQIEDKLRTAALESTTEKNANELLAKLRSGADAAVLAKSLNLNWNKTGYLGRYSTHVDTAILDLAFQLPNPATVNKQTVYGVTRMPIGYTIVALHAVKAGSVADNKQFHVFAEQVQTSEGVLEYELYKQSQMKAAKIKVTPSF